MKKQFFLLALMIFSGILFTSVKENGLKACGTSAASGSAVNKCKMVKVQHEYVEDADLSYDLLMNPFTQL